MLIASFIFIFMAFFLAVLAFMPLKWDDRPTLKLNPMDLPAQDGGKKRNPLRALFTNIAKINTSVAQGPLGRRMAKDLGMSQVPMSAEEFLLLKELFVALLFVGIVLLIKPSGELFIFAVLMSLAAGYYGPDMWLKGKRGAVKDAIIRDLPDTVDLLGLCVNAGLDFMMALKYVVEKSHPSVLIEEMRGMMQEINMGKPRRDALRDMARRHELPDLSTFARTLIQADRMGTSVSEALNILSEDMRDARFRRGEALAMKAPLKMLIPLLLFIFPTVAILVAGPVFLDFFQNNPLQNLGK